MIKTILNWFGFGKKENPAKMSAVVAQAPAAEDVSLFHKPLEVDAPISWSRMHPTETDSIKVVETAQPVRPRSNNRNRNRGRKKKHAMQSNNAATTAPTTPNANQQKRRGRPSKQK